MNDVCAIVERGQSISVMWDLLLETIYRLPTAGVVIILIMAIIASAIVNHILRIGHYATLASVPALLFAGILANAVLMINHIMLSPNKASNIVLAASFGFIVFAAICVGAYRAWNGIQERQSRAGTNRNLRSS